jgi:hypothetical protein
VLEPSTHPYSSQGIYEQLALHDVLTNRQPMVSQDMTSLAHATQPIQRVCPGKGPHLLQQLQAYGPLASNDRPVVIWWHKHCSSLCCYLGCCCLPGCYGRLTQDQVPWSSVKTAENSVKTAEILHTSNGWTLLLFAVSDWHHHDNCSWGITLFSYPMSKEVLDEYMCIGDGPAQVR